ncbi:MAG TPA: amino acid racemase [Candidatus Sulfotelmatobacter sp.]|jgi:aspartate racemase|nr:amino acid racemase [Candidatus Sulfotelmatobacter sp.]
MINNKKIGIIGGVGPQSTDFIYEKIIQISQSKYHAKDNADYPRLVIESVPVPDFISNKDSINKAKEMLIQATKSLANAGATRLCIGSNTVHILLDELKQNTDVPFISMIELVADKCSKNDCKKVGILGTPVLINSDLYNKKLEDHKIEAIIPSMKQLEVVENIIRGVIAGTGSGEYKNAYIEVLNDLFNRGADAIILGCTELPLAVNYEALGNRTINSDEILAEGIVDYYYSEELNG